GRVLPPEQPDETAVGGGDRRVRQVVVDHVMGQLPRSGTSAQPREPLPVGSSADIDPLSGGQELAGMIRLRRPCSAHVNRASAHTAKDYPL
ncbi:MAG TPA: hypothetical protein VFY70_12725, partial [Thermomicrobiales bacterium]|nr:hypothetical protein [Thermomicrobiales bacterium]